MRGDAIVLIAALALSACAASETAPQEAAAVEPAAPPVEENPSPEPATEKASAAQTTDAPPGAAGLIGLGPDAVKTVLGEASLERAEGPARILQFANGQCVLDVFFYDAAASFLAARAATGEDISAEFCYAALLPGGALTAGAGE